MLVFKTPTDVAVFFDEQAEREDRAAKFSSRTKRQAELASARAVVWRDAAKVLREHIDERALRG